MDKPHQLELSGSFQDLCGQFVHREVIENVGDMIDMLSDDEKLDTCYPGPDYVEAAEQNGAELVNYNDQWMAMTERQFDSWRKIKAESKRRAWAEDEGEEWHDTKEEAAEAFCDATRVDAHDYEREIYEWWSVTDWLGRKLKEAGEHVVEVGNKTVWGRGCTGQAIKLDSVIVGLVKRHWLPARIEEGKQAKQWLAQYELIKPAMRIPAGARKAEAEAMSTMLASLERLAYEKKREATWADLEAYL